MMFSNWRSRRKIRKAQNDKSSLGNILVDLGYMTSSEVSDFVSSTDDSVLLGVRLLRAGRVTEDQLEHALLRQQVLRGRADAHSLRRYGQATRVQLLREVAEQINDTARRTQQLADVFNRKLEGH